MSAASDAPDPAPDASNNTSIHGLQERLVEVGVDPGTVEKFGALLRQCNVFKMGALRAFHDNLGTLIPTMFDGTAIGNMCRQWDSWQLCVCAPAHASPAPITNPPPTPSAARLPAGRGRFARARLCHRPAVKRKGVGSPGPRGLNFICERALQQRRRHELHRTSHQCPPCRRERTKASPPLVGGGKAPGS